MGREPATHKREFVQKLQLEETFSECFSERGRERRFERREMNFSPALVDARGQQFPRLRVDLLRAVRDLEPEQREEIVALIVGEGALEPDALNGLDERVHVHKPRLDLGDEELAGLGLQATARLL